MVTDLNFPEEINPMVTRFLILGGYGNTGRIITRLLLEMTDIHLLVGGRTPEHAEHLTDEMNRRYPGNRVSARWVDAGDQASLLEALQCVNFVVVASSSAKYSENVVNAAMSTGIDYFDTQYSTSKVRYLLSRREQIKQSNRCFITDGGFHPGLPAVLIRYAAEQFDELETAHVGSFIRMNWSELKIGQSTYEEMIQEFRDFQYDTYKESRWQRTWKNTKKFDFGNEIGKKICYPMFLEEIRALPEQIPTLHETGFYIAGFNGFVDYAVMPLIWVLMKIVPEHSRTPLAHLLRWGLRWPTSTPLMSILQLVATGKREGRSAALRVTVAHEDGYFLTAVPVVACLLQYLQNDIRKPGVHFQAQIVKPKPFLDRLKSMGLKVGIQWSALLWLMYLIS